MRAAIDGAIQTAVAPLPTRDEMHAAIQAAVAPLATKDELRNVRDELRTHMDVIAESFRHEVRLVADTAVGVGERAARDYQEVMEKVRRLAAESDVKYADVMTELRRRLGREPRPYAEVMAEVRKLLEALRKDQAGLVKDVKRIDTRLQRVERARARKKHA